MTFENIIKDLKSKKYHPVYFLHGDEAYFIDKISNFFEENILSESEKAFNQIVVYGKDTEFKAIVDEARQFPMMSRYRLIVIKEAQEMKTLNELYSYVEKPSEHAIIVICHKYKKLDKRTKFGKLLEEKAIVFESKKLYENQLSPWIVDYVKEKGYTIEPKASAIVSDYIGTDLNRISNELDKLMLGLPTSQMISSDLVKEQIGISKEFNVFELQSALGDKNFIKANLIIRYFAENPNGNPLIPILSNLYGYFNKVYIALFYNKESDQNLSKMLGLGNSYFLNEYKMSSRKYTYAHLKKIFIAIKKADMHSKGVGVRRGDEASILKDILIACMNP